MFKIETIKLHNYRSCVNLLIEFESNMTALVGVNGSGKTNIMNGILLLKRLVEFPGLFAHAEQMSGFDESRTSITANFAIDDHRFKLQAEILFESSDTSDVIAFRKIRMKDLDTKGSKWKSADSLYGVPAHLAIRALPVNLRLKPVIQWKTEERDDNVARLFKYLSNIRYYSATQFSDPTKSPISIELDESKPQRAGRRWSHEQFLYDLFEAYDDSRESFSLYLRLVGPQGLNLVDDIKFNVYEIPNSSIKVQPGGSIRTIDSNRRLIVPTFVIDNLQLSPNQLSEGTYKTLALTFYILNDDTDLLLIEEPEVCVHHGLLGSIIELLLDQSDTKQIIVSTHSDFVLDKLAPHNVVVVQKSNGGTYTQSLSKSLGAAGYKALRTYLNESGNLGEFWKESGFERG